MGGNKLLPILGTFALVLALFAGFRSCGKKAATAESELPVAEVPKAPAPDADSPADTIRALTAQVASAKSEMAQLRRENAELLKQRNDIATQVTNEVTAAVRRDQAAQRNDEYTRLSSRLDDLSNRLGLVAPLASSDPSDGAAVDLDPAALNAAVVWVDPLGSSLVKRAGDAVSRTATATAEAARSGGSLLHGVGENPLLDHAGLGGGAAHPAAAPEPAYTVPRNATLIGSTGMTALIGRIPIKGQVEDPYPFKVIVGSDNLAANGLEIPGVDGMIFSGTAIGDWALSCVRGTVHSITFVFDDGTIRTLSSDDQSLQRKEQQSAQAQGAPPPATGSATKPLGWISDRRGIPCVTGARVTNAAQYLGGRILAKGVEAAGRAYARSQTTIGVTPLGGYTSTVTGSPEQYAAGEVVSEGANEVARWIAERQSQSFDAVFVDTGVELAVHVDRELPIDYEPKGRKLDYAHATPAVHAGRDHDLD
ncbi:TIGR03752 family integrating conjugative element protein [Methylocaldum sp. GT1TLB]|uniref:TIGR03752 family integrating conjugative element protein n=1 Tax=Methylocaldum sp. GT1TLB TaxID=3438965 RepID=UPI003DA046CA